MPLRRLLAGLFIAVRICFADIVDRPYPSIHDTAPRRRFLRVRVR